MSEKIIAYHTEMKEVIEFYDEDGVLVADLPNGAQLTHRTAAEALNESMRNDYVQMEELGYE